MDTLKAQGPKIKLVDKGFDDRIGVFSRSSFDNVTAPTGAFSARRAAGHGIEGDSGVKVCRTEKLEKRGQLW